MSKSATSVERVLAALVNLEVAGQVAVALGAPKWTGRLTSALGMAAAGDKSMPQALQTMGRIVAAPGALTVSVLRNQGIPVLENAADKASYGAGRVWEAVDAEFTTEKE
jgi:hypothetical protein|tara:strand:- start:1491 stop:1817 length:327 start_codon:yes stop_codon:yes gene_type:complete